MASNDLIQVDRSRYDSSTINVCEIVACYIMDMIYNKIYLRVKDLKTSGSGNIKSITDGYRSALLLYYRNLGKSENMRKILTGIHSSWMELPGFSRLTFIECIYRIADEFTPAQDKEGFSEKNKRNIVKKVIMDVNSKFIKHVLNKRLSMVIDHRKQKQNVEILKNELVNIFLLEREELLNEYYGVVLSTNKNPSGNVNSKLKAMLATEVKEKIIAQQKMKKYFELAKQYKSQFERLKADVARREAREAVGLGKPVAIEDESSESELFTPVKRERQPRNIPPKIDALEESENTEYPTKIINSSKTVKMQKPQKSQKPEAEVNIINESSSSEDILNVLESESDHEDESDNMEGEEPNLEDLEDLEDDNDDGGSSDSGRYGKLEISDSDEEEPLPQTNKTVKPTKKPKFVMPKKAKKKSRAATMDPPVRRGKAKQNTSKDTKKKTEIDEDLFI